MMRQCECKELINKTKMNIITIISTIFMVIKISVMGVILMLLELMIAMRNIIIKNN